MRQTRQELLSRIDIAQPLGLVLRNVAQHFALGQPHSARILTQGYDDLNVLLVCEQGRYVAKLFNKAKSIATIEDHVRIHMALSKHHAPVPRILAPDGDGIYRVPGNIRDTHICISEFFEGVNFLKHPPQRTDVLAVTQFLATLHSMPLSIGHTYDSWGTLNLPQEFARKKALVSDETISLVAPLADAMSTLSFGKAQRQLIHGDLQRKHVLKNSSGGYCVLDFGCMDYSYPVVDLGIFLALFCLEGIEPAQAKDVITEVLTLYCAIATLPIQHIALLGTLIQATWASYLLTADYLMRRGDRSPQTRQWYRFALNCLRIYDGRI